MIQSSIASSRGNNEVEKNMLLRLLIVFPLLLSAGLLNATVNSVPESELYPDDLHYRSTEIIKHIIETYHYKKQELDDGLSEVILENYLKNLDSHRVFFLKSDVDDFTAKFRHQLDDSIEDTNLDPAFTIFKIHRLRVRERIDYARNLLTQEHDFNIDEDYVFDRREANWASDRDTLNELWRKRVKNDILNLRLAGKEQDESIKTLTKRYQRILDSTYQLNSNDVFQSFINAYTTAIEPHTAYFSPRTSENFDISMRLSLEGIGAVLRADSDYTQVQRIIPGGPADLSTQLHAEDKIIGVGQDTSGEIVDVVGWRLDDVVDLIRGPKGTALRLEVLPSGTGAEGSSKIITLKRDKIKLEESAAKSSTIELDGSKTRIGVIELESFYVDFTALANGDKNYRSTTRDVRTLLTDLEKENIDGLVIDLRGNGGGSLAEALELTGLFIETGPIVQTKDANGRVEVNNDPDPSIVYAGPMAVLVDRNSASASEIFAGAIQDYKRGVIIGEPTFGKGTVQNIVDLNRFLSNSNDDHGRLKTTIAQFFRISGGSNQHKGVVPDIIMPTAVDTDEQGERSFKNALPWDKVKPARFIPANAPVDAFEDARRLHNKRVESETVFKLLREELDLIKKTSEQKNVSLMESKRKTQREELTKTKERLENEFRIAQGLPPIDRDNKNEKQAKDEAPVESDVILKETAKILNDLIVPVKANDPDIKTVKNIELDFQDNL